MLVSNNCFYQPMILVVIFFGKFIFAYFFPIVTFHVLDGFGWMDANVNHDNR